jgi:hypothetical protein
MPDEDFIELYEGALPREACAALVDRFEASGQDLPGRVGGGVMRELKDSRDIAISGKPEWRDAEQQLNAAMLAGAMRYLRRYRYALLAPMMLQIADPATGAPRRMVEEDFDSLPDAHLAAIVQGLFRPGPINLQRYTADSGGYPYWHCELYPKDGAAETLHRTLLWTVYLNDGFEAGETEFYYQKRLVQPRTGALLLAPAAFTHTHRGNRPRGGDKYIATSWLLFQRAEHLPGRG